jgi:hypothetical protein
MPTLARIGQTDFDYRKLGTREAELVRRSERRIRRHGKKNLRDIIQIGQEFLRVKSVLGYRRFGRWRRSRVGWSDTTVKCYIGVAKWLAVKSTIIIDFPLGPTAALKLSARSVPEAARDEALRRARSGEKITVCLASAIIAAARNERGAAEQSMHQARRRHGVARTLGKWASEWNTQEFRYLARRILDHVDSLITAGEISRRRQV